MVNLQHIVLDFLERYQLLGVPVLAGFSGGADSTALLLALYRAEAQVTAVHFNHGIRGVEADEDEEWCRQFCQRRGIFFRACSLGVPSHRQQGESCEEAGRRLRLEQWKELSQGEKPVFLAHHRDDALEELFLRLGRGSNTSGLVPMKAERWIQGLRLMRPLLEVRRAEIEAYLRENGIEDWRVDSTNTESTYRRNAIRNRLLPLFREIFGNDKGLVKALTAISADAEVLESLSGDGESSSLKAWQELPLPLLARRIRTWLESQCKEYPQLTNVFLLRLKRALDSFSGTQQIVPLNQKIQICIHSQGLSLAHTESWRETLWNWQRAPRLTLENFTLLATPTPPDEVRAKEAFDAEKLPEILEVRHWRNGDKMIPFGSHLPRKLQDLFVNQKIPKCQREESPLICANGEIIWAPLVRRAQFAPVAEHSRVIYLCLL